MKAGWRPVPHRIPFTYERTDGRGSVVYVTGGLWLCKCPGRADSLHFEEDEAKNVADAWLASVRQEPVPGAPACPLCGEAVLYSGLLGLTCAGLACANGPSEPAPSEPASARSTTEPRR